MSLARLLSLLPIIAVIGCGSASSNPRAPARPSAAAQQQDSAGTTSRARPTARLIPSGRGHLALMASARGLTLRDRPAGKVVAHLRPATEWGSPTVVWAAQQRGRW